MSKGRVFRIPVSSFKRGYLELPRDFAHEVAGGAEERPLILKSPDGARYSVILDAKKRSLEGLGEWYRANEPISEESHIVLEALDDGQSTFSISLDPPRDSIARRGLFLGKRYHMVAAQKYEARDNYYLPLGDLVTHVFICGATGSGKTVAAKAMIEEAALKGIPCVVMDLKGDLSSLMLLPKELTEEEFVPWVSAPDLYEKRWKAGQAARKHREGLDEFRITQEALRQYAERTEVRVFTPRSAKGIPVSFSSYFEAPEGAGDLYRRDPETFQESLRSLTDAFVERLYPSKKRDRIENERNFIYEIVKHQWLDGRSLVGKEGIQRLLLLVQEPPFQFIGGLPVPQYIDAQDRRSRLMNKINTLLSGPETMWFEGRPLDMNLFLTADRKTPINVINLSALDQFEDRSFVVAQVANKLHQWMRSQPGAEEPTLLFFIDEIGGGGGKQALFPSHPYECAAKWGLNQLVKTGRSFGLCCAFASQNPGDIDYRALTNCRTWMVGTLATARDRSKVFEGMELSGERAKQVERFIVTARPRDFVVKEASGEVTFVQARWLRTYHRVLTLEEISQFQPQAHHSAPQQN